MAILSCQVSIKLPPKISDGQDHFHYLREATKPISEADRHAKKELKKRVRGIRPIERGGEGGGGGGRTTRQRRSCGATAPRCAPP